MTFVDYISILSLSDSDCSSDKNEEAVSTEQVQSVSKFLQLFVFRLNYIYSNWLKNFALQIYKVTYFLKYYF